MKTIMQICTLGQKKLETHWHTASPSEKRSYENNLKGNIGTTEVCFSITYNNESLCCPHDKMDGVFLNSTSMKYYVIIKKISNSEDEATWKKCSQNNTVKCLDDNLS